MANAVFAYENLAAAEGAAITAYTPLTAHPASRLTDGLISQRCWLEASTGSMEVDLGDPVIYGSRAWGLVALLGTNLILDQSVMLEATDDASWTTVDYGPVELPVSSKGNQGNRWLLLPEERYERFLRITIIKGPIIIDEEDVVLPGGSGVVLPTNVTKIGQLLVASPMLLDTNFSQSYAVQNMAGVNVARTAYGVTRAYKLYEPVESWQIPFTLYPREDREKLVAMWQFVGGTCSALLFIPDSDDSDRLALWCRAVESLQTQFDYWRLHDLGSLVLPLMEEAMPEELSV